MKIIYTIILTTIFVFGNEEFINIINKKYKEKNKAENIIKIFEKCKEIEKKISEKYKGRLKVSITILKEGYVTYEIKERTGIKELDEKIIKEINEITKLKIKKQKNDEKNINVIFENKN